MYPQYGLRPDERIARRAASAWCIGIGIGLVLAAAAAADPGTPLSLAEAERIATTAEPGTAAFEARAEALRERARAAAVLPDPVLNTGLNNFPLESGGFRTEGMTHAALALRQAFPPAGARAASVDMFEGLAGGMQDSAEARTRDVVLAVRTAWLDVYHRERAHALVTESRPFFEELATITRSLYAVGRRSQQDVLHADLELSRLDDRLIDIGQQRAVSRAVLGEWIGVAAGRPLPATLPEWRAVPPLAALKENLARHPRLAAAGAEVEAKRAGVALAETRSKPGWSVQVGYSYRDGLLPDGAPRSDFVSVGITVDLPWFRKDAVDATLAAALSEKSAAEAGAVQLARSLEALLGAEHARLGELDRRLELYETHILGQTRLRAEAALSAYQSDEADFANVMRAYIDDLNTRIDHVRLQVERATSYATLASLGGIEP
ncbi:MAG: TolC family protein [Woeseiaceae bacterium]|nr:TolC family protein [Woeseiaceae bacterium]